ncbi:ABC transporter ATP-binding protein [Tenggerimyces flavus]|uniref:ABC transporter ATP-binding protein n=1 Tax=Tenggerimyces flavus TaxID=1708749 RepID=A0ABV7YJX8_9ACTN|nr:ABC transporter ATP-binding protein [Tenggerimyces flavus]MBM7787613.1 ATP-binding cassette subfamily C protein [Tenggerimyces flavus]
MTGPLGFTWRSIRRPATLGLALWSLVQAIPTAISGLAVARALDEGFLAGKPMVGAAWLAAFVGGSLVGAVGARQLYRGLGSLVEPFRDDLVRRVVGGALRRSVAGEADDGAVARLTRQVEIVRDSYAGLLVVVLSFAATAAGVAVGLASVAPAMVVLILPPFLLGVGLFAGTLGLASRRHRESMYADERLATVAGTVLAGTRDVAACGAEDEAAAMVERPIATQAAAERALARVAALRTLCFAIGGWLPLLVLLAGGPWLVSRGLSAGAILGGLTYVLFGLQSTLRTLMNALGDTGVRYIVTLRRILSTGAAFSEPPRRAEVGAGAPPDLAVRGLTFAYGPQADPVLSDLDLTVPYGTHLAIVGPSGIGKSTLAGLLCGLLRPGEGAVELGGVPVESLAPSQLASLRVLIPQEAYVFAGTVLENVSYLNPDVSPVELANAAGAVGAEPLLARLGGLHAEIDPGGLSAGERQLIALVRAYVSPAPVVVLDEATCHLDPVAEERAEEAFGRRPGTLIVIAHRISSARRARQVLVLDGSKAALGTHDTLLETSTLYRDLFGHWAGVNWPDYTARHSTRA